MRKTVPSIAAVGLLAWASAATADGLEQFDKFIKPDLQKDGKATWSTASAIGDRGFALRDLVLTPPPDEKGNAQKPIRVRLLTVDDIDYESIGRNEAPVFARMRAEGIAIEPGTLPDLDLTPFIGSNATAELTVDYRMDPKAETFNLNRLEIRLDGLARVELSMVLDGVTPASATAPDAKDKVSLRTATLTYDDHSLLPRLIGFAAAAQNMQPDLLIAGFTTLINAERKTASPDGVAALDALSAYAEDFKQPRGALHITLNPPNGVKASALPDSPSVTDGLMKSVGLSVSYSGTRPWKGIALSPETSQAIAGSKTGSTQVASGACAANTRYYLYSDNSWQPVTAREPIAGGRECVVRPDGGGPGDDIVAPSGDLSAWSMDGPGRAAGRCQVGEKVVAESGGIWYPGTVKAPRLRNGKCPVHFDDFDEDEDEDVTLSQMRVMPK